MALWLRRHGRGRDHAIAAGVAALGLALLAWEGLRDFAFNDYDNEASSAVHALTSGQVARFLSEAPAYGGSLAMRSPFALLPGLWGGGELAVYRMLALPCLVAAGLLALWTAAQMSRRDAPWTARLTVLALIAANPVALFALQIGHPEEILGGALCVAALISARAGRWALTGALLGLAVANKSWAVIAVLPALATLPRHRGAALLLAGAVAGAVLAPFTVEHHLHAGGGASALSTQSGPIFQPGQWWWWLGRHGLVRGSSGVIRPGYRIEPGWLSPIAHPLIVALSLPLTLLWRSRGRGRPQEPLALLSLLLLARCALDPWDNLYYAVPFLFALVTWEVLSPRSFPLVSLAATAAACFDLHVLPGQVSADMVSFLFLAWSVPIAAGLSLWLFAPELLTRVASFGRRPRLADVEQLLGEAA